MSADNESDDAKKKRLDVKRNARRHAFESFDPEKAKAKQLKRRKQQQRAPAATVADAAAVAAVRATVQPPALTLEPAAAPGPTWRRSAIGRCSVSGKSSPAQRPCWKGCESVSWTIMTSLGR